MSGASDRRTGLGGYRSDRRQARSRSERGFTYIALLAAIVIIGISMTAASRYWQNVMLREKEEELLFRGDQYRQAIERYITAIPGKVQYPQSIENLLSDDRTPQPRRYLRHQYKDPISGDDFELFRDQTKGNRIIGVFSKSEKTPLKQSGFPEPYKDFEGKQSYKEWQFLYNPPQQAALPPGALPGGAAPPPGVPVPPPGGTALPPGMTAPPGGTTLPPGFVPPPSPGGAPVAPGSVPVPGTPPPSGNPYAHD